ncbi:MAG: carboxypeptidase-like regulatory domain-containing protein, partial [Candidatus Acidiferrales bacterium]
MRVIVSIAFCFLLVLALAPVLPAQTATTGALAVTVTDPSGAVVVGATITLTGAAGETRTQTTGADGTYTFALLPVGNYEMTVAANGFRKVTVPSVVVTVAETHVLHQALEVGSQTQQVTVNAMEETIETESSGVGSTLSSTTITSVPLATRNFTEILDLSTGATSNVNDASQLGRGSQNIFVNGTGDMSSNFKIDGGTVNGFQSGGFTDPFGGLYGQPPVPSPDAIQEFKTQTSMYDAGYGKSGGANVEIVTKSGTNTVHGSAFEFVRNNIFNANTYFANLDDRPRGELKQNQYGGTIGGPIKRDKFFGFFSYEGTRQLNGVASQGFQTVSLPEQLTDNRTAAALGAAFCPANNPPGSPGAKYATTFLGSTSPVLDNVACDGSNINPVALALLNFKLPNGQFIVPSPQKIVNAGTPQAVGFASFSTPASFHEDQAQLNFDYVISPKHTLSEKFFYDYSPEIESFAATGAPPGAGESLVSGQEMASTKLTSLLSANLVNEAHFDYLNLRAALVGLYPVTTTAIGETPSVPYFTQEPVISVTGLFSFGGSGSDTGGNPEQNYEYGDQLSWSHGRHTVRMGFTSQYQELNAYILGRSRGTLAFEDWADFLLGESAAQNGTTESNIFSVSATVQEPGGTRSAVRAHYFGSFIQDDFKMSSRLTWNLGLRWEYNGNAYDTNPLDDQLEASFAQLLTVPVPPASGTFVGYTAGTSIGTPLPAGIPQRNSKLYTEGLSPLTNFAPRVGFAWQPFGSGRPFVVRGGSGIFYYAENGFLNGIAVDDDPGAETVTQSGSTNALSSLAVPYN